MLKASSGVVASVITFKTRPQEPAPCLRNLLQAYQHLQLCLTQPFDSN